MDFRRKRTGGATLPKATTNRYSMLLEIFTGDSQALRTRGNNTTRKRVRCPFGDMCSGYGARERSHAGYIPLGDFSRQSRSIMSMCEMKINTIRIRMTSYAAI